MHFHRDILIIADVYAREVLKVQPEDVFVGSPPIAFTFGLGGLAVFPLRFGASAVLIESATPPNLVKIIEAYKATVCFTAPTAYRAMLAAMDEGADLSSLRVAVSAGETLPAPVYEAWTKRTGVPILDGIGSTEMLHVFIGCRLDDRRPGVTGKPVPATKPRLSTSTSTTFRAERLGGSRCGARPAAAISRTPVSRNTCRTAGTSPATRSVRMRMDIFVSPRATTT